MVTPMFTVPTFCRNLWKHAIEPQTLQVQFRNNCSPKSDLSNRRTKMWNARFSWNFSRRFFLLTVPNAGNAWDWGEVRCWGYKTKANLIRWCAVIWMGSHALSWVFSVAVSIGLPHIRVYVSLCIHGKGELTAWWQGWVAWYTDVSTNNRDWDLLKRTSHTYHHLCSHWLNWLRLQA